MSRYEQRRTAALRNPQIAAGYREMEAEMALLHVLDEARKSLHITQEELAQRMGKQRAVIARLLSSPEANPTIATLTEILQALGLKAEITLRPAAPDESPIEVKLALAEVKPYPFPSWLFLRALIKGRSSS
jgi:transcriptional regulator with XRE-family HTH domain